MTPTDRPAATQQHSYSDAQIALEQAISAEVQQWLATWESLPSKEGRLVQCHFPNPKHDSHDLHGRLVEIISFQPNSRCWTVRLAGKRPGRVKLLHPIEFRLIGPLRALAQQAE